MYDEIDEKKEKRNSIILTVMIVITILLILVTIGFFLISKINDDNAEKNAQDIVKEFNDKKLNLDTQNGINEPGNTTILGHNYRSNLFFSKNHTLKVGDKIYIKDNTGREVEYTIYRGFSTNPNDATYMRRDTKGETEVSLSTCSDDSQKRYVVLARKTSKN